MSLDRRDQDDMPSMRMVNDMFIKEYVSLSIRYFRWLRSIRPRHRDECLKITTKKIKEMFRLEDKITAHDKLVQELQVLDSFDWWED